MPLKTLSISGFKSLKVWWFCCASSVTGFPETAARPARGRAALYSRTPVSRTVPRMNPTTDALAFTPEVERETRDLYQRVRRVIPDVEWPVHAPLIAAINRLKRERKAIILVHNYMTAGDLPRRRGLLRRFTGTGPVRRAHAGRDHRHVRRPLHGRDRQDPEPGKDGTAAGPEGRLLPRVVDHGGRRARTAPEAPGRTRRHLREHVRGREGRIGHLLHLRQRGAGGRVPGRG